MQPTPSETVHRHRWVLTVGLIFLITSAVIGGGVKDRLSPAGGFRDPSAESTIADAFLDQEFGAGAPNLVAVVSSTDGRPAADLSTEGAELTTRLAQVDGATDIASFWSARAPSLQSRDGDAALIVARLVGSEDQVSSAFAEARDILAEPIAGVDVAVGGEAAIRHTAVAQSERDLKKAELVAAPLVLLVLLIVFRSAVAALLPLLIGVASVLGTFAILTIATKFGTVSIFALNLTTALGFGLAIDYSLLFVTRYRSELASGSTDPVGDTMKTAGRSILFSALTTAAALATLLVFPLGFLRSMALAGSAVVVLSAALALGLLPAVLTLLGPRLERWTFPGRSHRSTKSRWRALGAIIGRRPGLIALGAVAFLLALGGPFLGARWGLSDDRIHAPSSDVRQAHDQIREDFDASEFGAMSLVFVDRTGLSDTELEGLALEISSFSGVGRVDAAMGSFTDGRFVAPPPPGASTRFERDDAAWLAVIPNVEPLSGVGRAVVHQIRSTPLASTGLVGGITARQIDTTDALLGRVGLSIGLVMAVSLVLLAVLARSIFIPLKALVLNVLSLSATLGAVVWIFQDGHLSGVLNFTATGTIDLSIVVLIVSVAFGLSMDYEVFLVSRMREEYDAHGDNREAVVGALENTATIITASAALIAIVFGAFLVADITVVKMSGLGIALAVVVDAVIVRSTLTPALMFLAGRANWWWPFERRSSPPSIDLTNPPSDETFRPAPSAPLVAVAPPISSSAERRSVK